MSSPSADDTNWSEVQGQSAETEAQALEELFPRRGFMDGNNDEANTVPKDEKLSQLSAADFRVYNSLSEHMEYFVRPLCESWLL
jgi:hypothetical protein